jgi:dihydroorotate dehydrogenase (NAD+) catalytic subunit
MGVCGSCDCGGFSVCRDGPVFDANEIFRKTEFGRWKRDKIGARISIFGNDVSSVPLSVFVPEEDTMLKTVVCDVNFPNPLTNAAGTAVSGAHLYRFAMSGAGAMVPKSACLDRREGYNSPTFVVLDYLTPLNAIGLSCQGVMEFESEIKDAKQAKAPIIGSVFGQTEPLPNEYGEVAFYMKKFGVDMIEGNISCPHTKVGTIEEDPELVKEIVKAMKQKVGKTPVFVKVSPNAKYVELAKAAVEAGADGITAINTLRTQYMNETLNISGMGNPAGFCGKSGKAITELGKKIVYEIREEVDVPIIGVGGIFSGKDIIDYAMNGASLFQLCSVFVTEGIGSFEKIKKEVREYLVEHNYNNLSEIVNMNHRK